MATVAASCLAERVEYPFAGKQLHRLPVQDVEQLNGDIVHTHIVVNLVSISVLCVSCLLQIVFSFHSFGR